MTALRRYIFAAFAICLAFAAGVAIGNGPLQDTTPHNDSVALAHANARQADAIRELRRSQAFSEALGKAAGPAFVKGRLANTDVAVFVLPKVSPETVTSVVKAVNEAGGQVVVRAHISPVLLNPGRKTYVDSVGAGSLRGLKDLASAASESPYTRMGTLAARAYTGPGDTLGVDGEATRLDAQLQGAKLFHLRGPLQRRGSAVIVLAPGEHGDSDAVYARHQIETQLIDALAGRADALLVASTPGSTESGGLLREIAESRSMTNAVSTLNVVDTSAGQVAVPPALAAAVAGQPGNYGMRGGTVVLPPGLEPKR